MAKLRASFVLNGLVIAVESDDPLELVRAINAVRADPDLPNLADVDKVMESLSVAANPAEDKRVELDLQKMRDKAFKILASLYKDESKKTGVMAMLSNLGVKRFSDVPLEASAELLTAAEKLRDV